MKTRLFLLVAGGIFLITSLLIGCATPNESTYQKYTQSYSKSKSVIRGRKLGILPFECLVPSLGNICYHTAVHLIDSGFELIEYSELSQFLRKHDANISELVKSKLAA